MMLPILHNHDSTKVIGRVTVDGDSLLVEFHDAVTLEVALEAFGSLRVIEWEQRGEQNLVKKAQVFYFSTVDVIWATRRQMGGYRNV